MWWWGVASWAVDSYVYLGIATAVVVTFALRATPLLIKTRLYGSAFLENLGKWMPMGAMFILLVYCLDGVEWGSKSTNVAYGLGLAVTIVTHLWRRNAVLSIVAGTVVCVVLATFVV